MNILKIKHIAHSGQGESAMHKKVLSQFRISEKNGIEYCLNARLSVNVTDILLTVTSAKGFKMVALIQRNQA